MRCASNPIELILNRMEPLDADQCRRAIARENPKRKVTGAYYPHELIMYCISWTATGQGLEFEKMYHKYLKLQSKGLLA